MKKLNFTIFLTSSSQYTLNINRDSLKGEKKKTSTLGAFKNEHVPIYVPRI